MIEIIVSSIIGSMIGLGACGYINSINNERAIEELKYNLENLKKTVNSINTRHRTLSQG